MAWLVRRGWSRGFDAFRDRRQRMPDEWRATGETESLGYRGVAAFNAADRRLDREGIQPHLRGALGADCAAASSWPRISQAGDYSAQARREKAEGFHRGL